ncbi:MAG TPA: flagellar export protein FliJ [Pseudobacteroides sp.]|uniref:flagellar export protein FliJ n=1 Tax=Pseudobacteroides sp. TaxID=1968840 RepID=UPI002F94E83D
MAKFKFRLQPLLNIKIQLEDSAKNELGKAVQRLEEEKEKARFLVENREKYISEFQEKTSSYVRIDELKGYTLYISKLAQNIELQNKNIKEASDNVDRYREDLIKIVKERKILEKLKEKKYKEYLSELGKDEQKRMDEIVSYKYTENEI